MVLSLPHAQIHSTQAENPGVFQIGLLAPEEDKACQQQNLEVTEEFRLEGIPGGIGSTNWFNLLLRAGLRFWKAQ